MSTERDFYVISYDVQEDRRRTRIANILSGFGSRVQYSVFECFLTKNALRDLTERLLGVYNKDVDSIRVYQLCQGCQKRIVIYGQGVVTKEEPIII